MRVGWLFALTLAVCAHVAAFAQTEIPQDLSVIQALAELIDRRPQYFGSRGGNDSSTPIGAYTLQKHVLFQSGYKSVDTKTQAAWAYALHQYLLENGGCWENYEQAVAKQSMKPSMKPTNFLG